MTETIVIRAPEGTKTRWVRRAGGRKLSDWIVQQVDRDAGPAKPAPCPRCGSTEIESDGQFWQCAKCGLVA